jgi:apolipoprotein N-acyltransferase
MTKMQKEQTDYKTLILSKSYQLFFSLISLVIVAFGQPAWSPVLGLIAGCFGYTLFFRVLLAIENQKSRFWLACYWFTAIQIVQLSWMLSHPFYYIYAPYVIFSVLQGIQFGLLGIFITPLNITQNRKVIGIAAFWVLMEWSRLFFMSGFSWNPAGIALTGNIVTLQMASFFGIYGLSFWVILVNLFLLKCYVIRKSGFIKNFLCFVLLASVPYIYGFAHLAFHESKSLLKTENFSAILVQPSFAVDATDEIHDRKVLIAHVISQWRKILEISKQHVEKDIDLIVLPEYVVAFGTYTSVFPLDVVKKVFKEVFGEEKLKFLAPLDEHLSQTFKQPSKKNNETDVTFVNNAYWLQSFANVFDSPIIAGLEDVDDISLNQRNYYSASLYFSPSCKDCAIPQRYEKRVLVPLGEYIPFSFCQQLAISYGVNGSFTKGEKAKVFSHPKIPFGASICYEETFGHVMRENRQEGAELLVNLTNDGWFPNSKLTKQHFDHARVRSVECGIPLIRACNTGITGGIDSLGRIVSTLGADNEHPELLSDSLFIEIPMYTYQTIYSKFGDNLILIFSFLGIFGLLPFKKKL